MRLDVLVRQAIGAVGVRFCSALVLLAFNWWVARYTEAAAAGAFLLGVSTSVLVVNVARLGVDLVVVRLAATFRHLTALRHLYLSTVAVVLPSAFVCALALYFYLTAATPLTGEAACAFSIGVPLAAMTAVHARFEQALGVPALALVLLQLLHIAFAVGGFLIFVPSNALGLALCFLSGHILAFFFGAVLVAGRLRHLGARWIERADAESGSDSESKQSRVVALLRAGAPLWGVDVAKQLREWLPFFLLAHFAGSEAVAVWAVTIRVASLLAFFLLPVGTVLGPRFARSFEARDGTLEKLALLSCTAMGGIALAAFGALWVTGGAILEFFHPDYAEGLTALYIIATAQLVNAAAGSCGTLLSMVGEQRVLMRLSVSSSFATASVGVLAVPNLSLEGAALAAGAGLVVQNLATVFVIKKRLGFWMMPDLRALMRAASAIRTRVTP